jgi:hypothetical protein
MKKEFNKINVTNIINSVIKDSYGDMPSHFFRPTIGFEHRHDVYGKNFDFDDLKQKISDSIGVPVKSYKSVMYIPTDNGHLYVHHAKGTIRDGFLSVQSFKPAGYENDVPPFRSSKRDSIIEAYLNKINESVSVETTNFYNFSDWKKAAKKHGMTVRNMGPVVGALERVDIYYADHENESFGGIYHKNRKSESTYFNYGSITHPKEIIKESINVDFKTDNPGGEWEKYKQEDADATYHRNKGITGSVTGWFTSPVELDVSQVKHLRGLKDEHLYRDDEGSQKMHYLKKDVAESGGFNSKEHPIFITVNHRGEWFVSEGNHRLAYAKQNGIKKIYAEVRYYNGGEKVESDMHPSKIKGGVL